MALQLKHRQAATEHERSLSTEERRRTGAVYTPDHLVEFVLDLAGYTPDSPIESCTLLDPACGCGIFLEYAVRRLVDRWQRLYSGSESPRLVETIESNLAGLDKDKRAAHLTIQLVRHTVDELVAPGIVDEAFFDANVTQNDFLDAPRPQLDLFDPHEERHFDFIVGNPPYVTTTRLADDEKNYLRDRFVTAHGRIDLYSLFFERALELLVDGGTLAFITPDKFLTSESAIPLRKLITSRGAVCSVARFRSHRIFNGAATVPCVTVIRKGRTSRSTVYLECNDPESLGGTPRRIEVIRRRRVDPPSSFGEVWSFLDPELHRIAMSLKEGHPTLQQTSLRISAGIATGRDRIFVIPPGSEGELEPELLHPCLRGQDLRAFEITTPGAHVIVPYTHQPGADPRLVDLRDYPRINAYLEAYRSDLEARHCVRRWGKAWFDIHDPWTLNITKEPKILFPDVANSNRFAFDEGSHCPLHSVYYAIPQGVDPEYLTVLLNSTVIEFLVRLFSPLVKDGFSRYRKQFVKTLPVPRISRREQRSIVRSAAHGDAQSMSEDIASLFELASHDRALIDDFVQEARGLPKPAKTSKSKAA